jgi:hypothetical protein
MIYVVLSYEIDNYAAMHMKNVFLKWNKDQIYYSNITVCSVSAKIVKKNSTSVCVCVCACVCVRVCVCVCDSTCNMSTPFPILLHLHQERKLKVLFDSKKKKKSLLLAAYAMQGLKTQLQNLFPLFPFRLFPLAGTWADDTLSQKLIVELVSWN